MYIYMMNIMYSVKRIQKGGASVRVTREQAAAHREKILDVAGTLFRERGFDGIGVRRHHERGRCLRLTLSGRWTTYWRRRISATYRMVCTRRSTRMPSRIFGSGSTPI